MLAERQLQSIYIFPHIRNSIRTRLLTCFLPSGTYVASRITLEAGLDTVTGKPLEVEVRDSLEKAMKILKQRMSKEGILQEVKRRRFYEKPSVKKKRKTREARKRRRREMKRKVTPR
ncbi:MAG: 30S ribosomal protein S21 [Myxococcales bacterium]|nr:30S ribosomal protein S21 [Myxococcales bacterium]